MVISVVNMCYLNTYLEILALITFFRKNNMYMNFTNKIGCPSLCRLLLSARCCNLSGIMKLCSVMNACGILKECRAVQCMITCTLCYNDTSI